jgi:hypothetical protein
MIMKTGYAVIDRIGVVYYLYGFLYGANA